MLEIISENDVEFLENNEQAIEFNNNNHNNDNNHNNNNNNHNNNNIKNELPFPNYIPLAFYCLSQKSKPRYWLLKIMTSTWFEKLTMIIIIINCITMGMHQPCNDNNHCTNSKCFILKHIDDFIYAYFVFEMLIKMFAMGLIGKRAYFGEGWNILDCFIVIAG